MSRAAQKLISASGGKAYEVEQSIMLNQGDDAYLHFTPSSSGSRTTFTYSVWMKMCGLGADAYLPIFGYKAGVESSWYQNDLAITGDVLKWQGNLTGSSSLVTTQVFRDQSAWYHIVFAVDTTQSTASNRMKIYVNGSQITAFSTETYPAEDEALYIGMASKALEIGRIQTIYTANAYFAEAYFIENSQLTPSSFGETDSVTGQWIPIEYTGSYGGNNSFYLKFVSGAIGTDSSGEGNNFTAVNLANADVMLDTPTNNFAVFNPLHAQLTPATLTQGNLFSTGLQSSGVTGNAWNRSTFLIESGAWYVEFLIKDVDEALIAMQTSFGSTWADYVANDGAIRINGSAISYGSGNVTSTDGDIIALAFDRDNNYFSVYKNGSALSTNNTISAGDITVGIFNGNHGGQVIVNFGQNGTFCGEKTAQGNTDGNGVGDFYYSVPSGYKALCSKNLATPTIKKPTEHFNTVLYTGDASSEGSGDEQAITGVGFQPDFVWIKARSTGSNHLLHDVLRGPTKFIRSDTDNVEATQAQGLKSFDSDGFTVGDSNSWNQNSRTLVAWNWKAGGSGSTNTDGSEDSTVSVNTTAGFSIADCVGAGPSTYGHGLGVTPKVVLMKGRDGGTSNWYFFTSAIDGSVDYLFLNTTAAKTDSGTTINSSIFTTSWGSGTKFIVYSFAEVEGFSKFGTYTGNNSTDGPYVYTGFRPAFILFKDVNTTESWNLFDNKRNPYNFGQNFMWADLSSGDYVSGSNGLDLLSNGFKIRANNGVINGSTNTWIYMAFAEAPFKYANAR